MDPDITVVIPVRAGGDPRKTLISLEHQTYRHFHTIVVNDHDGKGAPWARNQGLKIATTEFVLFSDDDVDWTPWALDNMRTALLKNPDAAYSYGAFRTNGRLTTDLSFNPVRLLKQNFISTMSLIRWKYCPAWDESLQRLQDCDLWLSMLEQGHVGVSCGCVLFDTKKSANGITNGTISYQTAEAIVRKKHGI